MSLRISIKALAVLALAALFPLAASAQTQPGISVINGHHGGMGFAPFPIPEGLMNNARKFTIHLTSETLVRDPNGFTVTVTVVEPEPVGNNPPPPTNTVTTTECCFTIASRITGTITNNFVEAKRLSGYTISVIMLPGLSVQMTAYTSNPPTLVVNDFFSRFYAISVSNRVATIAGSNRQVTVHHYGVGVRKFPSAEASAANLYSSFDYETEETILLLFQAGTSFAATQVTVANVYEPFPANLAKLNNIPLVYARRGANISYKISDRTFNVDQQDRSRLRYSGLEVPSGLAVSQNGVVSGVYRGAANIESFVIQVQDSQSSANRAVAVMTIMSDTNSYFETEVSVSSIPQSFGEGVLPQGRSRVTVDGGTTLTVYDPHRIGSFSYVRKGIVSHARETFGAPTLRVPAEAAVADRRLVMNTVVNNSVTYRPQTIRTTTTVQLGSGPSVQVVTSTTSIALTSLVRIQKYVFSVTLKQGATLDYEAQGAPFGNYTITTEVLTSYTYTLTGNQTTTSFRSVFRRQTISLNAYANFALSDGGMALTAKLPYAIANVYEGGLGKIKEYNIRGTLLGPRDGINLVFDEGEYVRLDQVGGTAPIQIQAYGERVVAQEITIRGGTTLSTRITVEVPPGSGRQQTHYVVTAIQGGTTLQHISVEPRGVIGKEIVTLVAYTEPWPWGSRTATRVTLRNGQQVTITLNTGRLNPYANRNARPSHNGFVYLTTTIDYLRLSTYVNRDDAAGGVDGGFQRYMNVASYDTQARICFGDGSANDQIHTKIMEGTVRLEPITAGVHKGCQRIIQIKGIGSVAAATSSVSGRGNRSTIELINVSVSITSPASDAAYAITMLVPVKPTRAFPDFSSRGGPVTVEAGVYFERIYGGIRHEEPTRLTMRPIQDGTVAITENTGAGIVSQLPTDSRDYLTLRLQGDGMKMFGTVPQPGTTYVGIATSIYLSTGFDLQNYYSAPVTSLFTIIATEARKPTIGIAGIQTLALRSVTTALTRSIDTGIEITVARATRAISSLDIKSAYKSFFTFSPTLRDVATGTAALQLKQGTTPVFPTVGTSLPLTIVAFDLSGISSSLTVSLALTEEGMGFGLGLRGKQTVRLLALEPAFAADAGTGVTLQARPEKNIPITLVSINIHDDHEGLFTINTTLPISETVELELQVRKGASVAFKSPETIIVSVIALGQNKSATVIATLQATTGLAETPPQIAINAPDNYVLPHNIATNATADVATSITVEITDPDLEKSTDIPELILQTHDDKFMASVQAGSNPNSARYLLYVKQRVTLPTVNLTVSMIARDEDGLNSGVREYEIMVSVGGGLQQKDVSDIHNEVTPIIAREIMHLNDQQLSEHVAGLRSKRDRNLLGLANQEESAWVAELRNMISGRENDLEEGELSFKEFIAGQSFSLPLSQSANGNSGGVGFGMWGRGDYTKLSQDLKEDGTGMKFEGDILSGSLGLEGIGRNLAGGLAVGYHKGEFDLTLNNGNKPVDYDMAVYTVNPYIAVFLGDASSVWGSFSYGMGDVELVAAGDGVDKEDPNSRNEGELTSMGYSIGASSDVLALMNHQGPHSLDLRLQYSASKSDFTNKGIVEGQAEIDDIEDIEGKSLRVGMKYKAALSVGEESQFIPSLAVYGRRNSTEDADVDAVSGFEAVTGLAFQGSNLGLAFNGRYLQIEELDAYGGNMTFSYSSVGSGGLGLSFSMTPAYGGLGTGEALYDAAKISDLAIPGRAGLRVGSEASYGMAIPYGLLTPYASYRLSDASTDEYTLGMRYNYGFSKFGLNLQGAQGRDDHDLKVEYHLEFEE